MTVLQNPLLRIPEAAAGGGGGSGYQIEKSLRFNQPDQAYLEGLGASGNQRTFTISFWVKRSEISRGQKLFTSSTDGSNFDMIYFQSTDELEWYSEGSDSLPGSSSTVFKTSAKFRDTSAWMHVVISVDTTQSVADDRVKVYINGKLATLGTYNAPAQNRTGFFNKSSKKTRIGANHNAQSNLCLQGYLADVEFIDGLALNPAAFGEFDSNTGVWNPKAFALPTPNTDAESPTWSSGYDSNNSTPNNGGNAFDGSLTTYTNANATQNCGWNPPNTIEGVTEIRLLMEIAGSGSGTTAKCNDVERWADWVAALGRNTKGWWTVPEKKLIKNVGGGWNDAINFANNGNDDIRIYAIEVDGVILVDGREDPTDRTTVWPGVNDGTTWSSVLTTSGEAFHGSYPATNAFDGSTSTSAGHGANSASNQLHFAPASQFTGVTKLRLYKDYVAAQTEIRLKADSTWGSWFDTPATDTGNNAGWINITSNVSGGKINGIDLRMKSGISNGIYLRAIEINDCILIDSAVDNSFHLKFNDTSLNRYLGKDTLNGVLADATGALPIYNTTDDYGDVKGSGYRADSSAGTTDGTGLILAIPGDGAIADVHHSINTGSSVKSLTATSVVASDTSDSRFYGSSFKLDAQTDGIEVTSGNSDFAFGTGNFTIEMWVNQTGGFTLYDDRPTSTNGNYVMLGLSNTSFTFKQDDTDRITATIPGNNTGWKHLAAVRNSGTTKLYCNGIEKGSWSDSTNYISGGSNRPRIGHNGYANPGNYATTGSYQDIRVYKGVAKYTANFKPPTRNDFTVNNLTEATGTVQPQPILKTNDAGTSVTSGYSDDNGSSSLMLALHGSGSDGGTTFTDVSNAINSGSTTKSLSVTNGDPTTETDQSKFYGSSLYFDGDDELTISDTSELQLGTGQLTWEFWFRPSSNSDVKVASIGANQADANGIVVRHQPHSNGSNGELYMYWFGTGGNSLGDGHANNITNINAWNHFAITRDSGNEVRFFLNGKLWHTQNDQTNDFGSGDGKVVIGNGDTSWGSRYTGYIADMRIYKGYCKYTVSFTIPTTSISAENTKNSVNVDSLVDTPTNYGTDAQAGGEVRGNYCTWNPLNNLEATLSNGNLDVTATAEQFRAVTGTLFPTSGKWYFETTITGRASDQNVGIAADTFVPSGSDNRYVGRTADSWGIYGDGRKIYNNTFTNYASAWSVDDVLGIAYDLDAGKMWFAINNTWQASGNPATGANETFSGITGAVGPACAPYGQSGNRGTFHLNTGQRAFKYTAPSGFKCLCAANLDDTFSGEDAGTINNPSKYFNVTAYTGSTAESSGQEQEITGLGFQPDLVWIKSRSKDSSYHYLYDAIRGATYALHPNVNDISSAETDTLKSFDSDGFTLGDHDNVSGNNKTYISWSWDAGTAGAANDEGSTDIASPNQWKNATAGFSITKYTGNGASRTIGHGLGAKPDFWITKDLDEARTHAWRVWHKDLSGMNYRLELNKETEESTSSTSWNNTAPTSDVLSLGADDNTNKDGNDYIMYCWTPIPGYSAFGKYTGTGDSDTGQFCYTGFKPKFLLVKRYDSATGANWGMVDSARSPFNKVNDFLYADTDDDEADEANYHAFDFLSNGFKPRGSYATTNTSGGTYIWAAFAEHPLKTARAQ